MIKAIIFDVDGVLLDNNAQIIRAFQQTAIALGMRVPPATQIRRNFGQPWWIILERLFGKKPDKLMRSTYQKIWRKLEIEMLPRPGTELMLRQFRLPLAIVTSKRRATLERQLGWMLKLFSVVITAEDVKEYKPDSKPLLLACKKLQVKPDEAVYIGDALNDILAAKAAGMRFIGVLAGGATKKDFTKAKVPAGLFAEMPALLKKLM